MEQPPLPARIGKYELLEFLGGGMSHVYRARDTLIGGTVALKILTEAANADPDARARFLREARMARNVAHENIIAIYDFGEEQGRPYMVMEFLKGEDLRTAIQEGHTGDLPQKLRIAIQVARAMEFIHAQGIVHRDVKPDNINIGPEGKIKLMDFGIAKTEDLSITRAGYTLGTPYYMSPEQVMGQKVTHLTDIYAFGILLFELMTGVKPIKADTVERIFYEILRKPIDLSPLRLLGIPQPVCDLVSRCTAKAPASRVQSFTAVREQLQRILEQIENPAAAPSPLAVAAGKLVGSLRKLRDSTGGFAVAGRKFAEAFATIRQTPWLMVAGLLLVVALVVAGLLVSRAPRRIVAPLKREPARVVQTATGDMVLVSAGAFLFGKDRQRLSLPAFYIDRTEVSNRAYAEFCRATARPLPPGFSESRLNYPVADVTFADAEAFARWAQKRLPTAQEWEKAARGSDGRLYPWGHEADPERANLSDNRSLMVHAAMPVESFKEGAAPCGALNLVGNVAEFVKDRVSPAAADLDRFARLLQPPPTDREPWHATRGGGWTARLAAASPFESTLVPGRCPDAALGFRCVRSAE